MKDVFWDSKKEVILLGFSIIWAILLTFDTSSTNSGIMISMHWAWERRTLGLPTIEWRAFMKLDLGFFMIVSNLEFLDSSAIDLISSKRCCMMRSILLASRRQRPTTVFSSWCFKNCYLPVGVMMHWRLRAYLPTKNLTDLEPNS